MTAIDRTALFILLAWHFIEMYSAHETPPWDDGTFIFRGILVVGYGIYVLSHILTERPHD